MKFFTLRRTVNRGLIESRTQEGRHRFYRFRTPLRGRTHRFYWVAPFLLAPFLLGGTAFFKFLLTITILGHRGGGASGRGGSVDGRGWESVNSPAAEERGVCNGYVTAVSVALSGGARTVSINKIWKNLDTFLLLTVSLSPGLTVPAFKSPLSPTCGRGERGEQIRHSRYGP